MVGEGFAWRVFAEFGATPAVYLLALLGIITVGVFFYLHNMQKRQIDKIEEKHKEELTKIWNEVRLLNERYHRSDTLQLVQSKLLEASFGVRLVNESANGDGDYALDRGLDNIIESLRKHVSKGKQ